MTQLRTAVLLFAVAPLFMAKSARAETCLAAGRGPEDQNSSMHRTDDEKREIRLRRGDCEVRLDARGAFSMRADLSGFISVDEYVEIEENDHGRERGVRITRSDGQVRYRWNGGDERWLASVLLAIERHTGMNAKERVPELLRRGGVGAVLDETAYISSDHGLRAYFMALFKAAELDEASVERVLKQTGDSMSSDYERAEVLRAVAAERVLSDRLAHKSIAIAQQFSSDYEKRRALLAVLESVTSPESRKALFTAAATMSSSYELAELLIAATKRRFVDTASSDAYFKAVGRITSDYERRRTLSAMLKQPLDSRILTGVFESAMSINSDFELATLLVEAAELMPINGQLRELYLSTAKSIQSDFEYRRALEALLGDKHG